MVPRASVKKTEAWTGGNQAPIRVDSAKWLHD